MAMKNSPSRSKYLLMSITLFVLSLTILFMFMLALGLPYTERPLHDFPVPTPTPTPPEFTRLLRFSHYPTNPELNILINDQQGRG
jgi:hypothetical protein